MLTAARRVALIAIAALTVVATLISFAESYRALYLWASAHQVPGGWAWIWPAMADLFIAVGELTLFVAISDKWSVRSRLAAWATTLAGLSISVAGNVGHVTGASVADRMTAALPPLAATAALAVGLGILKRLDPSTQPAPVVAEGRPAPVKRDTSETSELIPQVAARRRAGRTPDAVSAAEQAARAALAAGRRLSGRQLAEEFALTRYKADRLLRQFIAADGHRA